MTGSSLISRGALAAILVAGCVVAPAAVAQSGDHRSSVKDSARANVYVPPSPDTAIQQDLRWLEAHGTTQDPQLPDARETANVYVPPAQGLSSAPDSPAPTQTIGHAAVHSADDSAGPWAVIGLVLGCAALLGGAGLALVHRARRAPRGIV